MKRTEFQEIDTGKKWWLKPSVYKDIALCMYLNCCVFLFHMWSQVTIVKRVTRNIVEMIYINIQYRFVGKIFDLNG